MSLIVVLGQIDLHAEDAAAAEALMRVVTEETNKEQGCLHYAYSRDLLVANRFQLSELWESEESLAAHLQTPHTATYRAGIGKLRVVKRSVKKYDAANPRDL
jgi:quinol monooxygenase YgiN